MKVKITHKRYLEKVRRVHSIPYKYLTKYKSMRERITIKCLLCESVFKLSAYDHYKGIGCSECQKRKKKDISKRKHELFVKGIRKKTRHNVTFISQYIDENTKIEMKCENGHLFSKRPPTLFKNSGLICPHCILDKKKQEKDRKTREFLKMSRDIYGDEFEYITQTISTNSKIKIKCSKDHVFKRTVSKHLLGLGCPQCHSRKYEYDFKMALEIVFGDIDIEVGWKPDWLINPATNGQMEMDLYIPSLNLVVEINGIHHYVEIEAYDTTLQKRQLYDYYKKSMCELVQGMRYASYDLRYGKTIKDMVNWIKANIA